MTPELSIVIPAYNEACSIGACLQSLARQKTERSYEVVLVDNNSTDSTVEAGQAAAIGLQLRVVREPRQGRGAARRAGFEAALGHIIFSADADTVYPAHWLQTLLALARTTRGGGSEHDCPDWRPGRLAKSGLQPGAACSRCTPTDSASATIA